MNKVDNLIKKMSLNAILKVLCAVSSFIYTPLLFNYLGEDKYGVWITLLSVLNWVYFFDLGVGNSSRYYLIKYINENDYARAKKQIFAGYFILTIISACLWVVGLLAIAFFDINILIKSNYDLSWIFVICLSGVCISFILSMSKAIFNAVYHTEYIGFVNLISQILNIICLFIFSKHFENSLVFIAFMTCSIQIMVNFVSSVIFFAKHSELRFSASDFSKNEITLSCNLGGKYLLMQINALIIFSTDTILINNLFGSVEASRYNIIQSVIGYTATFIVAFIEPVRTKITINYENKSWIMMRKIYIYLCVILPLYMLGIIVFDMFFEPITTIWLGHKMIYTFTMLASSSLYYIVYIWGEINATFVNAINRVKLECILGTINAIVNIPLSIFLGKTMHLKASGVILATVICLFISQLIMTYDIVRWIKGKV